MSIKISNSFKCYKIMKQLGLSMDKHSGFLGDAEEGSAKLESWYISEFLRPFLWAFYLPFIYVALL